MRVIAGSARGRRLLTREGVETRPTADRFKETLFAILQFDVPGSRFLDLFAGSGAIGVEALSRGAKSAVFVEKSPEAVSCIEANLRATGLYGQARLIQDDAANAVRQLGAAGAQFDLIFMDPPYEKGYEQKTLDEILLAGVLARGGRLVIESSVNTPLDPGGGELAIEKVREYRVTKFTFLRAR